MVSRVLACALLSVISMGVPVVHTLSTNPDDLRFLYYPSSSSSVEIIHNNLNSLVASNIKENAETFLVIDGFLSDATSPMSQGIKDGFLRKVSGSNVIVMDWGKMSGSGATLENSFQTSILYTNVLKNVGPVGERVADFLNFLKINKNIDFSKMTIVGHSLGAHISGAAGNFVITKYGGTLKRITGLDPAGPFFSQQTDEHLRLHKGDATFVAIYHTNRGTLGDSAHQTGDINVYVNGGDNQPGCEEADAGGFAGYCSHSYSWKLYKSLFDADLSACPCSGFACQCADCTLTCASPVPLGYRTQPTVSGALYVRSAALL